MNHPKVAIVGSGPSGCYAAQFIRKYWEFAEISIFEALPVPYGLARYGIAADHQGNKSIIKQFDRLFERENVNFIGHITIGKDVSIEQLKSHFDYVIQATGLFKDKTLPIPIDAEACLLGAGNLLRLINSCPISLVPEFNNAYGNLGKEIAIIGAGNVALDVARLLTKTPEDLNGSDVNDTFLNHVRPQPLNTIHIINRSDLSMAKFDLSMFKELVHLPQASIRIDGITDVSHPLIQLIEQQTKPSINQQVTEIIFHFNHIPQCIKKIGEKTQLNITESAFHTNNHLCVDTLITAIGFEGQQCLQHQKDPSLIQVGWFKRGSVGTVADNRKDTKNVINELIADYEAHPVKFEKEGLKAIKPFLPAYIVNFNDWKSIEAYERLTANANRCRNKVTNIRQILNVIEKSRQHHQFPNLPMTTVA